MTKYELEYRNYVRQLLERIRIEYGHTRERKALLFEIKDDGMRRRFIRALRDTRHDDVIISMPIRSMYTFMRVSIMHNEPIWMGSQPE